jgi:hypothetical protein
MLSARELDGGGPVKQSVLTAVAVAKATQTLGKAVPVPSAAVSWAYNYLVDAGFITKSGRGQTSDIRLTDKGRVWRDLSRKDEFLDTMLEANREKKRESREKSQLQTHKPLITSEERNDDLSEILNSTPIEEWIEVVAKFPEWKKAAIRAILK